MNEEQKALLEEVTSQGEFFNFEEGERVKVTLTDWKLERKDVPDFNDSTKLVNRVQFSSTLLYKEEPYKFNTLSVRFINAIKKYIIDKEPTDKVTLSIKKIGKKQDTQYDVELAE